jgi:phospholipase/carboxylesterase
MLVVLLHGYSMRPADLSPFAHSLGIPATFLLPRAPVHLSESSYGWWAIDGQAREESLRNGARDLADDYPDGIARARAMLAQLVTESRKSFGADTVVVGGFSQGGMLACDSILEGALNSLDALFLLSSSRIRQREWEANRERLRDLPVFVCHGTRDPDLAFAAGERLQAFLASAGARVTWAPFDGGHEIPLVAWRQLRRFLLAIGLKD